MTDSNNGGPAGGQPITPPSTGQQPPPAGQQAPQLNVLGQYVKDFSFENPNAPRSLAPTQEQPQLNIQINIGVQAIATTDYEVTLKLDGKAESKGSVLFAFELTFCGVFRIQNLPQEHMQPMLMIECPRLLFPFAREIVATAVRNGGYAPLLLDPIDFVSLYHQRLQQQAQQPQFTTPS
jgi:preprotein translocase subunit SecB